MRFKRLVFFIIIMFNVTFLTYSLNMSSTTFDKRIDNGEGYSEVVFKNDSEVPIRYKFSAAEYEKKQEDMSSWVNFTPRVMTIPPFSERTLKIFAQTPKNEKIRKDEYSFYLKIDTVKIPTIMKDTGKIRASMQMSFIPIIEMMGYVGDPDFKKNILFKNSKIEKKNGKIYLIGELFNNSYAGKQIGFSYIASNGFILGGKWLGRLGANKNKKISLEVNSDKIEEISIYDADSLKEIKRVKLNFN